MTDLAAASMATATNPLPTAHVALAAIATVSRPLPIQTQQAEAPQAANPKASQIAVADRSCSGKTAHSDTTPSSVVDSTTHHPYPCGPKGMPVASATSVPRRLPSGMCEPHDAIQNRPASQPQAR